MKSKHIKCLKKAIGYIYVYSSYIAMVYFFSYKIRMLAKPIGLALLVVSTLGFYAVYIVINHLIIKKIISKKVLITIEILLLITLYTLFESDIMFENRLV